MLQTARPEGDILPPSQIDAGMFEKLTTGFALTKIFFANTVEAQEFPGEKV